MIGLGSITTEKWIRTRKVASSYGDVYYARHRLLGSEMLVHLLPLSARLRFEEIVAEVASLPARERAAFLDAGVRPGGYYLVTIPEPYYEDLERVFERFSSPACLDPAPAAA